MRGNIKESELKTAVAYLRVSTKDQAQKGGQLEGFSIPAQRAALYRKAESLGATIIEEFTDAGESAKSAHRPDLQRMLAYLAEHQVDYVLVHKVDRLARNRVDDVEITMAIKKSGATLVSASENIDETPSGMLLHGIMSSIAEFYSRNLATEVHKGMSQKAKTGGTPGKAPLGYRNVGRFSAEGREERTVEVDSERAELISWTFVAFATGDWTLRSLADELERRGLTTRQTPKQPARPLRPNVLHKLLTNPYYKGDVTYRGVAHQGRHEPLTDLVTWQRVQDVLAAHALGEKRREHPHYLKSSVFCGDCESRLIVTNARNRHGVIYPYFVCLGRQMKRTSCRRKAMLIASVECLVEQYWAEIRLDATTRAGVEAGIRAGLSARAEAEATERKQLRVVKNDLVAKREKLVEAIYSGALPQDLIASEQKRLAVELARVEGRLESLGEQSDRLVSNLKRVLDLAETGCVAYLAAEPLLRRLLNQAVFTHLYIDDRGVRAEFARPFNMLLGPGMVRAVSNGGVAQERGTTLTAAVLSLNVAEPNELLPGALRAAGEGDGTKLFALLGEGLRADSLVPLRDSLSNISQPLERALQILETQGKDGKRQKKRNTTRQIIDQSGAVDPSVVRLQVKENRKLSPDEVKRLVQAYESGSFMIELAKRFGVHEQTVRRHLRRHRQARRLGRLAVGFDNFGRRSSIDRPDSTPEGGIAA